MQNKIPKVINYCWFGGSPLPDDVKKCINSWKKYCPDYEIRQWNETNFDLNICSYVREASKMKKWAFVSDYARFWILYKYGGLYMDTDVELIKPIDTIVNDGPFFGRESANYDSFKNKIEKQLAVQISTLFSRKIVQETTKQKYYPLNPGLGMAAVPHMQFYKYMLRLYNSQHFLLDDNTISPITVVDYATALAKSYGFNEVKTDEIQNLNIDSPKIKIYPVDYFCPMNYETGKVTITSNTVSIHHYSASWLTPAQKKEKEIKVFAKKHNLNYRTERFLTFPVRVIGKVKSLGIKNFRKLVVKKLKK